MGGPGSGSSYHWWRSSKKTAVEDCKELDLGLLAHKGAVAAGRACSFKWSRGGRPAGEVGFLVRQAGGLLALVLSYRVTPPGEDVEEFVPLVTTRMHRGGLRWWGRCPLLKRDRACGRRVGKLYLPPGNRYFGCRQCYDLTYRSCQESRKYDGL
jgi:hypothetical protein